MRYIKLIPVTVLFILSSCSQLKNDEIQVLSAKLDSLTVKVSEIAEKNNALEIEILMLEYKYDSIILKQSKTNAPIAAAKTITSPSTTVKAKAPEKITIDKQCQAITSSGKRCSHTVVEGSTYCYQHKQIYEPEIPQKK